MPNRSKKKEDDVAEGAPGWMVTYGDMMSLLLTFFILIVSFSSIQEVEFEKAMGSLKAALGVLPKKSGLNQHIKIIRFGENQVSDEMIREVREMKAKIAEKGLQGQVKVTLTDKGAHIVISDPVLFDLGKAELRPEAKETLDIVAELIHRSPNTEILVEGHTDNWPINNEKFPSNWELSAARALSVVKYFAFRKGFDPERFAATGYGEYRPLKPNDTAENRAKNRRVEIYVNVREKPTMSLPPEIETSKSTF